MQDRPTIEAAIDSMTREYGASARTFTSGLIWCVPEAAGPLREEVRKCRGSRIMASTESGHETNSRLEGVARAEEVAETMQVGLAIGSIVEENAEVIVNSANVDLVMGKGVAAAILYEAGPAVEEEAIAQGPVQVGDVVVTSPGDLAAKHIVHVAVVGAVPPDIYECTMNALEKAVELGARSIALPALGTGSAGVPPRVCAREMARAIADHGRGETTLEEVRIVLWDEEWFPIFDAALGRHSSRRALGPAED